MRNAAALGAVVVLVVQAVVAPVATDGEGQAVARFRVPRLHPGEHTLAVRTRSAVGEGVVARPVQVADATVLVVRTDRREYRPGQSLRWRAIVLSAADAHPLAEQTVAVAVADPRGTEIWRGEVTTGKSGMAAGAVPL